MKKLIFISMIFWFILNTYLSNNLKELGYEIWHYIKTGEKVNAQYVYFYIVTEK